MLGESAEDYLKSIYELALHHERVTPALLAERRQVSAAAVSKMVRKLTDLNLVDYSRTDGLRLTPAGEKVALEILRHHRLLELYLQEALGYSWDRVHDEAETLEHSISEEFEDRIDALLGYPTHDPHGHPIPTKDGRIDHAPHPTLADLNTGERAVIRWVSDREPDMLRHLGDLGFFPKTRVEMVHREPYGGSLHVRIEGANKTIGRDLARQVFVSMLKAGKDQT